MKCTRLAPGRYRLDGAIAVATRAIGLVEIEAGYEWDVGLSWARWPWPSDAMLLASLVHDRAYDLGRSADWLHRADAGFTELYAVEGGHIRNLVIIIPMLRARAHWAVRFSTGEVS